MTALFSPDQPPFIVPVIGATDSDTDPYSSELINVEDWRGTSGDSSDTGTLLSAIAAAKAAGGMLLHVPARTYTVEQELLIDENHITLIGEGSGYIRSGVAAIQASARSRFRWAGAAGGAMVRFNTPTGMERRIGGGLQGIMLDGAGFLAARGVVLESWSHGYFHDVFVYACSESQFRLAVVNYVLVGTQPADVQHNLFEHCYASTYGGSGTYLTSMAYGWHITGGSSVNVGNSSINSFIDCHAYVSKGISWKLENCDDNFFYFITGGAAFDAAQYGVELGAAEQDSILGAHSSRYNSFYGLLPQVHARAGQSGGVSSFGNVLFGNSRANAQPRPVIETAAGGSPAAVLTYWDLDGNTQVKTLGLQEAVLPLPTTTAGLTQLYVDAAAGAIKSKNSAGTISTLVDTAWLTAQTGSWTPVFSFQTPGDSVISHTTQLGKYLKLGNFVFVMMDIAFDTNAYTTAAGVAQIAGLPYAASVVDGSMAIGLIGTTTFTTAQELSLSIPVGGSVIFIKANTSNAASANVGTGVFLASKTAIRIRATGTYWTNAP